MNEFIIKDGILESCTLKEPIITVPDGIKIIGTGAFKGCTFLQKVVLPETIDTIGSHAFKGCKNMESITLPSNLSYLGDYAFHRCHSLKQIELPFSVKELGNCVFLYCDSLESVTMPGVTTLGKQVFLNDIQLKRLHISSNLSISCICDVFTGCSKISDITLDNGYTYHMNHIIEELDRVDHLHPIIKAIVIDIARMMKIEHGVITEFLTNIKELVLPEGITVIGKSCFSNKRGILSVTFPETLNLISSNAFTNCIGLEKIEFRKKEITLSNNAFKNCTNLKYISFTNDKTYEFNGIELEKEDTVPEIMKTIHTQILKNFLISGTILLKYLGNESQVTVPFGITKIGANAFAENESIDRIILPDTINEIGQEAFRDCLLLQTISLPTGITKIGTAAFMNCVKLIRAELPDSLQEIKESLFNRCKTLREIKLGNKVHSIHNLAFYGCHSLKQIEFPNSLTLIGDLAFYQCTSLKEIYLPSSITQLGNNVFTGSSLKTAVVSCNTNHSGTDIFSQCEKLKKLIITEGVTQIGDKLAFHCKSLTYVELPSSIKTIGRNAFEKSKFIDSLENGIVNHILIHNVQTQESVLIEDGITAIAGGAFCGNSQLTSISIPNTVKWIGARAFCGCSALKEIHLPERIEEILDGTFDGCTSLSKISASGTIHAIRKKAFYECENLQEVQFGHVYSIEDYAFYGCIALRDFSLLEQKLTKIGTQAFAKTLWLQNFTSNSDFTILSSILINGTNKIGDIIIPDGIERIAPYAFYCNDKITSICFPDSIISIEESAFWGCNNLKTIEFLGEISNIGEKAFEKCTQLSHLSCKVETIGKRAFAWCTNLKEVNLMAPSSQKEQILYPEVFRGCISLKICNIENAKIVPKECFSHCNVLEDFNFEKINSIETKAFAGCDSITVLTFPHFSLIEDYAFEDCGTIKEINITKDTIQFDCYAFSGCTAIETVIIEEEWFSICDYNALFSSRIPQIVKCILDSILSCFIIDENKNIVKYLNNGWSITILENINGIAFEAFKDALKLEKIRFLYPVSSIGARAFWGTTWLELQKSITPMVIINNILIDGTACKGTVIIPSTIKKIAGWSFANCFDLTDIIFLSENTIVEELSFRNCINMKSITLWDGETYQLNSLSDLKQEFPILVKNIFCECYNCFKTNENGVLVECTGNIKELFLPAGIQAIGDNVFKESNLLTSISLSEETALIGSSAFKQCKWLSSVKNGFAIETIGKMAFFGCIRLKTIEFSHKLKIIEAGAFENCTLLEEIILPEGIIEIKAKTFYRCHNLKKVVLPSTLISIGEEAFAFCYELREILLPDKVEQIGTRAFAWCKKLHLKKMADGSEHEISKIR